VVIPEADCLCGATGGHGPVGSRGGISVGSRGGGTIGGGPADGQGGFPAGDRGGGLIGGSGPAPALGKGKDKQVRVVLDDDEVSFDEDAPLQKWLRLSSTTGGSSGSTPAAPDMAAAMKAAVDKEATDKSTIEEAAVKVVADMEAVDKRAAKVAAVKVAADKEVTDKRTTEEATVKEATDKEVTDKRPQVRP
jgi:hypothetical protein